MTAPNGTIHEIPAELRYPGPDTKSHKTWIAYAIAYEGRYHSWPVWNQTVGGQICNFIDRVGAEVAPASPCTTCAVCRRTSSSGRCTLSACCSRTLRSGQRSARPALG
ncbi:hypothetical protein ACHFCA_10440 [Delftia tsuruhatensis]